MRHPAILIVAAATLTVAAVLPAQKRAAKQRAADLNAFVKAMDRGYPFFKLKGIKKDWAKTTKDLRKRVRKARSDEEFMALVVDAMKCLRDGHMSITETTVQLKGEPSFYPGISLIAATQERVAVLTTVPGLKRKLPVGTVITKIDGKPARAFLEQRSEQTWSAGGHFSSPQRARFFEYRLPLSGARGAKHTIHYLDGKQERRLEVKCRQEVRGWPHSHNLPEGLEQSAKSVWHGMVDEIAFLYLRRMDASAEDGIAKAIAAHPDARGWVVDLRGNTGGGYDASLKQTIRKMQGPVAAIIDGGCVSAGETFTRDLVQICKARTFGGVTAGSSSSKQVFEFPSGIAKIRYSVRSRTGPDGKGIEYRGILPDKPVEADPELLAQGKNTGLEAALAWVAAESK